MIRYARSDAFNPKGTVKISTGVQNGWQETVKAGDSGYDNLPLGTYQLDVARAITGKNELIWKTRKMPADVRSKPQAVVPWQGGMGYFAEPQGRFTLYVGDSKLIDIPAISQHDAEWTSADKSAALAYVRDTATAEYGTFTLTLSSTMVTPGEPLLLRVVGSESNSRRWFGVFRTW
jgi:hypothetical protein